MALPLLSIACPSPRAPDFDLGVLQEASFVGTPISISNLIHFLTDSHILKPLIYWFAVVV